MVKSSANPVHGVLIAIGEIGLLLRGPSGTGKSECALELLRRGHRLVADDVVEITNDPAEGGLIGASPAAVAGRIEVPDVGIVEVQHVFGPAALRSRQRIHAVVDLVPPTGDDRRHRSVDPTPSIAFRGHTLPAYALRATGVTAMANRLEVIARLLQAGVRDA